MNRRIGVILIAALLAVPAYAGFDEVLSAVQAKIGSPTSIPGFGLIRLGIRITHYDGVHDLQLAVFEGKRAIEPAEADRLMRSRIGSGYTPFVRVRSKHNAEFSFIYARPDGDLLDMVVFTNDGEDTVLVRVVVNPDEVTKYLDKDPTKVQLVARR